MKIQSQRGRSMIEMLGVLGVMAVITVLAITAYKMAYKNSKMNELKQELGSINQQVDQSYANQKFMDEGVVLGEEGRTFDSMFVDTNMVKSSVTPFGGTYTISAISNDLFEVKLSGLKEDECSYVISDDGLLKKTEKMTIACVDVNGLTHYAANNINDPLNPSNPANGGGDDNSGGYTPSQDLLDNISGMATMDLLGVCLSSKNSAVCSEFLEREDVPTPAYYGFACSGGIIKACDKYVESGDTMFLRNACEGSGNDAVCQAFVDSGDQTSVLKYVCSKSGADSVCNELINSSPTVSDLGRGCSGGNDAVCDAFLAENPTSASDLYLACLSNNKDVCDKLIEKTTSPYYLGLACRGGNEAVCDKLLSLPYKSQSDLKTACTGDYPGVCDAYLETNPNAQSLQEACSSGKNESVCTTLLSSSPTSNNLGFACQGSGYDNVCQAWIDSGASVNNMSSGCGSQGSELLCKTACDGGDSKSCSNLQIIQEGGWGV